MRSSRRAVPAIAAFIGLAGWTPGVAAPQEQAGEAESRPAAAAALAPDTVRVGSPFTLGLSVAGREDAVVRFPPLIPLSPELEQLRPAAVEWDSEGGGRWTARYRLTAWKAGTWDVPAVQVEWQGSSLLVVPPAVHVTSVLPAASEGPLPLEGPRGPRYVRGFPWWLLLLLLALALLWWLLRRLRRVDEEVEDDERVDPAVRAREVLEDLKRRLELGDIDLAAYYDGLEKALREYLAARRGWPPERPVREFVDEAGARQGLANVEAGLRTLQERAGLVRFAHVAAAEVAALGDADACLAWVDAEEAEAA